MYKPAGNARAALMGILFAMVGFSYAIATNNFAGSAGVGTRANIGSSTTPLSFDNPFFSGTTDRDLGDAVVGSTLGRLVFVKGGVPPYTLTAGSLAAFSANSLTISAGSVTNSTAAGLSASISDPLRFAITATDSFGTSPSSVTESFRLGIVPASDSNFRFAIDDLVDGVQFQDYQNALYVINGRPNYTFAATNVTLDGTATTLEAIGLKLINTGSLALIAGKPFKSGTVAFTATATDATGATARNRANTASNQAISFVIAGSNDVGSSQTIATKVTIKTTGQTGKDSFSYTGLINLQGAKVSSLSGKTLTVTVGNTFTASVTLDAKGKGSSARGVTPAVKVQVSSKGTIKITVSKATLPTDIVNATVTGGFADIAVRIQLQDVDSTEVLAFAAKGTAPKRTLTYQLGKNPSRSGGFILTGLKGKDNKDTPDGDTWQANGFAVLPTGKTLTGASKAVIDIGSFFEDTINVTADAKLKVKGGERFDKGTVDQVTKVNADLAKGKFQVSTLVVQAAKTQIPEAGATAQERDFTLGFSIVNASNTVLFAGNSSLPIFSEGKGSWSSTDK